MNFSRRCRRFQCVDVTSPISRRITSKCATNANRFRAREQLLTDFGFTWKLITVLQSRTNRLCVSELRLRTLEIAKLACNKEEAKHFLADNTKADFDKSHRLWLSKECEASDPVFLPFALRMIYCPLNRWWSSDDPSETRTKWAQKVRMIEALITGVGRLGASTGR